MSNLYQSPLRVYICLGLLALLGIVSAFSLPVSLFPNSSRPVIVVNVPYGNLTPDELHQSYGTLIEERIRSASESATKVDTIKTTYKDDKARYEVLFDWGVDPQSALKNVEDAVYGLSAQFPEEIRETMGIWLWNENSGFIAISFFSEARSLDDLYKLLRPTLKPQLAKVKDAQDPELWNPARKEVLVQLRPEVMASLGVLPSDVAKAIDAATSSSNGGSLTLNTDSIKIQLPKSATNIEELRELPIVASNGRTLHISDIAYVDIVPSEGQSQSFRTSGAASLILFATPKPGGNIKEMAEEIIEIVKKQEPLWPKDVQYRILVDPSEFIRSSVNNVVHEVFLAAFLAVVILFLFIGSLKNVATAAIEIPLSIVLAFILMRLTGINLNMISLGGLALSAGMNVDASVVVMENIFRHFDKVKGDLSFEEKVKVVTKAVDEVRLPVIASTIASVVVFLPLAFTSNLSYAILGDLAKAVVFSHGFSAVVALILVPTIRLQLMSTEASSHATSPIEKPLQWLENLYAKTLALFIDRPLVRNTSYAGLIVALGLLIAFVLPKLPKEIIGKPDTDWVMLGLNTQGNTFIKQMETQTLEVENQLLKKFGHKIQYTFTQIRGANWSQIMARLKDKRDMNELKEKIQDEFPNTPFVQYWVDTFNPSELPIPDPPKMQISLVGGSVTDRNEVSKKIRDKVEKAKLYDRVNQNPNPSRRTELVISPDLERWSKIAQHSRIRPDDLSFMARVATDGVRVTGWTQDDEWMRIFMKYPKNYVKDMEDLAAIPVGIAGKIVPFKALSTLKMQEAPGQLYRENMQDIALISGRFDDGSGKDSSKSAVEVEKILTEVRKQNLRPQVAIQVDDAEKEMNDALHQLTIAIGLSILLIFVTMVIQLGDVVSSLLVLVSVPLGFIGVLISLFVFGSTLSLNSALGVILLNGLAVANSIILVDFLSRLVAEGNTPREAALEAAKARLRPILMTSLATAMGMLPIAIGWGAGGRILQPLGIAVSCGLWFSMLFTLFVVPSLQVSYLNWREKRKSRVPQVHMLKTSSWIIVLLTVISFTARGETQIASTPRALSFEKVVERLINNNLQVKTQRAALKSAKATRLSAWAEFMPTLSAQGKSTAVVDPYQRQREGYLIGQLNLFSSGADMARLSSARALVEAEEAELKQAVLDAEQSAIELVATYLQQSVEAKVSEIVYGLNEELARVSMQRYRKGMVPQQDALKAGLERDNSQARWKNAQQSVIEAKNKISTDLDEEIEIDPTWPWPKRWSDEPALKKILSKKFSLDLVPSYSAKSKQYLSAQKLKAARLRDHFPALDFTASHGYFNWEHNENTESRIGFVLTIPLFDLPKTSAYFGAGANAEVAFIEQEQESRNARYKFETAKQNFSIALESARTRDANVKLAESLFADNRRRLQAGRSSINDVVVDQNRLAEAQVLAASGWQDAHVTFAKYCHSIGLRVSECR